MKGMWELRGGVTKGVGVGVRGRMRERGREVEGKRGGKVGGRREEGKAGTLSYEGTEGESRGWLTRPCKRAGSSSAGKPAGQRRKTGGGGGREEREAEGYAG